jgi:2-oxoglutarate dehydrogenase E1 component
MNPSFDTVNLGYVRDLFEQYLASPETVEPLWRAVFEQGANGLVSEHPLVLRLREVAPELFADRRVPPPQPPSAPPPGELLGGVAAAMALVKAHRMHGHLAARLDPLGSDPVGDPSLEPDNLVPRLTPELQARIPAGVLRVAVPGDTLADALPRLRETYCGTMAYEIEHISSHEQRVWLRREIESGAHRRPLAPERRLALLRRLAAVEGFERFLNRVFPTQKQFSLEGLDALVPMLDESLDLAAAQGATRAVIGMAHRGRLNVLAHIVGRPYKALIQEFEGERVLTAIALEAEERTGDVKYHLGAQTVRATPSGPLDVVLASNPSHLEAVDPVALGETRAYQTDHESGHHDPAAAIAILIHGDASFSAQGIVAETLNLQALRGYATGGTLHLIVNNQVGFTTDPWEARSTRYSSDLAKGFDVPIVHVNADDPEAALSAIGLAMAFRARFRHDVVVDLVGYRRHGHNEQDEPAYTQPLQAARIAEHEPVRAIYADVLVRDGIVTEADAGALLSEVEREMREAHEELKAELEAAGPPPPPLRSVEPKTRTRPSVQTAVPEPLLRELNEQLLRVPDGFSVHPKLERQLARRRDALGPGGGVDWGQAEALAFASLLVDGVPIRLTGQDTERGTFAHRHLVLHDHLTGARHTPMEHVDGATACFEVHNSPLSEYAAVGFEYGYAVAVPDGLVLWEAQFGDFVNGAQVIVDQFVAAGFAKWGQVSRFTLLLPHGYEGNGPEHSSARMERFLQLAAQGNIRVANCSTPAQYFHLLRLQATGPRPRPLVIFTPKGLLRLKQAASSAADLVGGTFFPVLDDLSLASEQRERVGRLILCSGRVYYDIVGHPAYADTRGLAVARLEQLYPFPVPAYAELLRSYPNLTEVVWVQEEPQNMGPWRSIRHRLEESLPEGVRLVYTGRPWRASPSEGYPTAHIREQERFVREALGAGA